MNDAVDTIRQEPSRDMRIMTERDAAALYRFVKDNADFYDSEFEGEMRTDTYTDKDAARFLAEMQQSGSKEIGFFEKERLVAWVSLDPSKTIPQALEIHYIADKSIRGQGFIPATLKSILRDIEAEYEMIYAKPRPTNRSSIRVLQKLGFMRSEATSDGRIMYVYHPRAAG